jgi:magnesium transporter
VVSPDEKEITFLTEKFNLPRDFFSDLLDIDEIARFEPDNNGFLTIMRIPVCDNINEDPNYYTIPIGVIAVFGQCIITVSYKENDIINSFIDIKKKVMDLENRFISILQIIDRTVNLYITYLKHIRQQSLALEKEFEKNQRNENLIKLYSIEKTLINYRTSLRTNLTMVSKMQRSKFFRLGDDEKELLDDVLIDLNQAVDMAERYSDIMNELMNFFSSIINNNLNRVMKLLTAITIIIAVPTLVASIYGMNIIVPFQNSPHAFMVVMGISLFAAIIVAIIFLFRKWI